MKRTLMWLGAIGLLFWTGGGLVAWTLVREKVLVVADPESPDRLSRADQGLAALSARTEATQGELAGLREELGAMQQAVVRSMGQFESSLQTRWASERERLREHFAALAEELPAKLQPAASAAEKPPADERPDQLLRMTQALATQVAELQTALDGLRQQNEQRHQQVETRLAGAVAAVQREGQAWRDAVAERAAVEHQTVSPPLQRLFLSFDLQPTLHQGASDGR
jgi:cell division protein FtsB